MACAGAGTGGSGGSAICHNVEVSSYRDHRNPEVVQFPGTLGAIATLGFCGFAGTAVFALAVLTGPPPMRIGFGAPILLVLIAIARAWPRRISLGELGAWQYSIFGRQKFMIGWEEMDQAEEGVELPLLGRSPRTGFAANRTVVLSSGSRNLRIVHSPRHSDRERFLLLARQRIARPPIAAT
ncbi:MAG: hypothetical protein KJZ84_09025 [Bryobacteraceae bacterium]|nr:hypothetical protein [Bryobacteraceae bacterium]